MVKSRFFRERRRRALKPLSNTLLRTATLFFFPNTVSYFDPLSTCAFGRGVRHWGERFLKLGIHLHFNQATYHVIQLKKTKTEREMRVLEYSSMYCNLAETERFKRTQFIQNLSTVFYHKTSIIPEQKLQKVEWDVPINFGHHSNPVLNNLL